MVNVLIRDNEAILVEVNQAKVRGRLIIVILG